MSFFEYLGKKLHLKYICLLNSNKLYIDRNLETLHFNYKDCIALEINKHLKNQTLPEYEMCLKEKKEYYSYLNDVKRIEHDNLLRFFSMKVWNQEHPVSK